MVKSKSLAKPNIDKYVELQDLLVFTVAAKLPQSCPTLCDPIDSSPTGSSVPGILQGRILEWVAIILLQCMKVKSEREVTQSCPTQ